MAENAAHITSSLQAKPSIFEVIAQDSLGELLYPSFKIIVQVNYQFQQGYKLASSFNQIILPTIYILD